MLSDAFEGAFPSSVPWSDFTLRFSEASLAAARKKGHGAVAAAAGVGGAPSKPFNLTSELLAVAADRPRLARMQASLAAHAKDVLWEAEGSRWARMR